MLEVRRLSLLRELSHRGTIARVAAALHQSPSSVSQQLSQLEREVGVPLLRKVGRRLQLTPQAEILVGHTAAILARLEQAETDLEVSLDAAVGTVRIGIFQSAALALMPRMLLSLQASHPLIRVEMHQREPEAALGATSIGDFDLVVAEQYPGHAAPWHADLDRVGLISDRIRLATPVRGPLSHIRSVADAASAPWTMEPDDVASRHWAEQACRQAGFEPDVRYETPDLQAQIDLVESGLAVALIPDLLWLGRRAEVMLHDLEGDPRRQVFTATRPSIAQSPAIVACRETLVNVAASLEAPSTTPGAPAA
ncbi:LysR family transcriptional regulator [uncultured Aeromicrobium sp.]|uniref:LysR family transcriptional regulator n=1 Tax=uncultured Aeromicrobium sp. TaxID=337820 RepID=UPI0025D0EB99|nr:LysR family transcriptional regulator [uncultured Aeromicrobium sp.]